MDTKAEAKNRYGDLLAKHNSKILKAIPGANYLWWLTAEMVEGFYDDGDQILELGFGEGHSTRAVYARKFVVNLVPDKFHLVDISEKMVKRWGSSQSSRMNVFSLVRKDALEYMRLRSQESYGVVYSSWMVHNLPWPYKRDLFASIHRVLRPKGAFVLMDKVYTDDAEQADAMLDHQRRRYHELLPIEVAAAISQHELDDYIPLYRMEEKPTLDALREAGFGEVRLVDRVERDVVIVCQK